MEYMNECKYIWKNFVPDNGQSDNLHGELLRQIEKLRYEAINNGNTNWDDNFEFFCDFLSDTICSFEWMSETEKEEVKSIMSSIKRAGYISTKFFDDEDSYEELIEELGEVGPEDCAVLDDEPYDIICNKIGKSYSLDNSFIPYENNPNIYR